MVMNVNNLVAAVIVEVMIGLSSRLRAQKARTKNIVAVVVAIEVTIFFITDRPSLLIDANT